MPVKGRTSQVVFSPLKIAFFSLYAIAFKYYFRCNFFVVIICVEIVKLFYEKTICLKEKNSENYQNFIKVTILNS